MHKKHKKNKTTNKQKHMSTICVLPPVHFPAEVSSYPRQQTETGDQIVSVAAWGQNGVKWPLIYVNDCRGQASEHGGLRFPFLSSIRHFPHQKWLMKPIVACLIHSHATPRSFNQWRATQPARSATFLLLKEEAVFCSLWLHIRGNRWRMGGLFY